MEEEFDVTRAHKDSAAVNGETSASAPELGASGAQVSPRAAQRKRIYIMLTGAGFGTIAIGAPGLFLGLPLFGLIMSTAGLVAMFGGVQGFRRTRRAIKDGTWGDQARYPASRQRMTAEDRPDLVGLQKDTPVYRLERDYRPKFNAVGCNFNFWMSKTSMGTEVHPLEQSAGRLWGGYVKYAKRPRLFAKPLPLMTLEEAEAEMRRQMDQLLLDRPWEKTGRWQRAHKKS